MLGNRLTLSFIHASTVSANSVMLLAFVLVASLIIFFLMRARNNAREAASWRAQVLDLHELTRRTLEMNLRLEPGPQLAELVHDIFALEAVAVFDAELHQVYAAGHWNANSQELAQNVYYFGTSDDDPKIGLGRRVVRLGTVPIGSLVVRGDTNPLTNNAIASLIAIAFDRYRAFANESRMETERRTEQLRSTVLDGLAHAYKTPLTAIRAASTGLGEMGNLSPGQAELVALIDEQTGLLGDRLASMKVELDIPEKRVVLECDRQMMVMLLTQYIDNACKYSILGSTITIRAEKVHAEIVFSVRSFGPVILINDRERIFDR